MSCCRMHYHAFGLIDQNNILIFIDNIKIHLLWQNLKFCRFWNL